MCEFLCLEHLKFVLNDLFRKGFLVIFLNAYGKIC